MKGFFKDKSTSKGLSGGRVPYFSVLDCKSKYWLDRKAFWKKLELHSELGRGVKVFGEFTTKTGVKDRFKNKRTSTFDPVLCETMYNWFVPSSGSILDPFAGGSVRGIIAHYLGWSYTGIDLSSVQIKSNKKQAKIILSKNNQPNWLIGDSIKILDGIKYKYDFIFTCPPYGSLEKYSDMKEDLSNMSYYSFLQAYETILRKSIKLLKKDSYMGIVVGEFRDKNGNYVGFVADTIKILQKIGMSYYNDLILLNQLGSAAMRANNNMMYKKVTKVHQNVLIFKKE